MKKMSIHISPTKCKNCRFCYYVNVCHSLSKCIGCLACYWACPHSARYIVEEDVEDKIVEITVDGTKVPVPSNVTVAKALEKLGFKFDNPGAKKPNLSCRTGGCWSCAVVINGALERSCITPIQDGMIIETNTENQVPLRIVHGPEPHAVGGKATPWWEVDYSHYVEAAIWVAGCNLKCPQCQNYHVTYDNITPPLKPIDAAKLVVACHGEYTTRGIAISGGEPTINRRWLLEFFKEVTKRVKQRVRRHLDSNGTVLTPDYIDELVEAGCNNIGVEPKCVKVETYMKITGLADRELALKYLETAWRAVKYIYEYYGDRVYMGVGLVYNSELISLDEIGNAGDAIASIDPKMQVTVLDYFPAFRRMDIKRPTLHEMLTVKRVLEERGLKTVIVQTRYGHIGPDDRGLNISRRWN